MKPVLEINGADYAALLEIPSQGVTLPISNQWNSMRLTHSPSRFSGSAYDNSLVIGGIDHSKHPPLYGSVQRRGVLFALLQWLFLCVFFLSNLSQIITENGNIQHRNFHKSKLKSPFREYPLRKGSNCVIVFKID